MGTIKRGLTATALGVAALGCWIGSGGCASDAGAGGEVIRVGVFLREGGDSADEILAVREINAAGGITIGATDYQLELVRVFDGASAAGGVNAVEQFVEEDVVAAIGPRWSSIVLGEEPDHADGAGQAAIDAGLLMITGTATSAEISTLDDDDLIWRTVPSDDVQGDVGARYAYETRSARSVGILFRDDAWGRGLSATFARTFEALGGSVQASVAFDPELDFADYAFPELDDVFAGEPDLVYVLAFGEFPQITHRIVQGEYLESYGAQAPIFLATDGSYDRSILTNAAPEVLATTVGTVPGPSPDNPTFAAYLEAFEDAGLGPGENAWPPAYDAVYVLALAIQAAQSLEAGDFKRELRAVSSDDGDDVAVGPSDWAAAKAALLDGEDVDYDGASGPLELDAQGDPSAGHCSLWEVARDDDDELVFAFDEENSIDFELE